MSDRIRLSAVAVAFAGVAACGFPRPADVGEGGAIDASGIDASDAAMKSRIPSCIGLATTCGTSNSDSCCNSPVIPGDFGAETYFRSYDMAGDSNSGDASFPAMVNDFRLDKYEVTVGRFRVFVNAGMGTQSNPPISGTGAHTRIAGSGWDATWNTNLAVNTDALMARLKCETKYQTWTDMPGSNENRPMNCVSWYEATAFCAWDGGYLPTEAEWNYAAAGGPEQRAYPWSTPAGSLLLDGSHASYMVGSDCVGDDMAGCAITDLVPVGSKPAGDGRWGQSDLAGNVVEWVLDWDGTYPSPCVDCANLAPGGTRAMRGGCFNGPATWLRTGTRTVFVDTTPATRGGVIGFRCARPP
jgi:formylglycine-generating enzyme required for sulfatase activity